MNTNAAWDTVTSAVQDAVGPEIKVTQDPAAVGPRVASTGVAVLIDPPTTAERSSYRTWLLDVRANVVYPTPAPRHIRRAQDVADQIKAHDGLLPTGSTNRTVQLDAAMSLPAVSVTLQVSTEC